LILWKTYVDFDIGRVLSKKQKLYKYIKKGIGFEVTLLDISLKLLQYLIWKDIFKYLILDPFPK